MQTYGSIIPGGPTLARVLPKAASEARDQRPVSRETKRRLTAMLWHEAHGKRVSLTARHFGLSRSTVYDWLRRYEREGVRGLADRSRRPRNVRQPTWSKTLEQAVLNLREAHPRWGKDKLVVLLRDQGHEASVSMVGRILSRLRQQRRLPLADLRDPWMGGRAQIRPYAVRKPRDYVPSAPGDLVQIDSADVRLLPDHGHWYKHFSARDVVSRWDVLGVYSRATALTARDFLDAVIERMPGPVRAIQVDGGSEFRADFETACQQKNLALYVLPPRRPQLNGAVERCYGAWRYEFYAAYDLPHRLDKLQPFVDAFAHRYNHHRPHDALDGKTPAEYLTNLSSDIPPSHMS